LSIKHDPNRRDYVDLALTPITDDEVATHAMLQTEEANSYLEQQRKIDLAVKSGAFAPPQSVNRERQPAVPG
jgi:hypothetical protein